MTRSQLQQSAPAGKFRTIIGTAVKEEDKKPKLEADLYEQETKRLEELNRSKNKNKPWPKDARLVHIDGTECSSTCMKDLNNKYHSDNIAELRDATSDMTEKPIERTDPRTLRSMGMTTNIEAEKHSRNEPNNNDELEVATDAQENNQPGNDETSPESVASAQLKVATVIHDNGK